VGADDYRVYAFNASTGALVWKTSPFPNSGIVRSTPAVSGGSVYVDTGETTPMGSHLYVLSTSTGAQLCNHEMADYATSSVAIANGLAIVGSYSFQLYVFDASTCDKLWDSGFTIMQGGIASSPAVSNGAIYVGSNDDGVYAFEPSGGVPVGTLVSITDSAFSPKDAIGHDIGKSVQWTNNGSQNHTVTDSTGMGMFDSGTITPGNTFTFAFFAACIYKYKDSLHAALTGTVKAPVIVSPTSGGTTTTFTIQWATAPPAAGDVYDVQIQRPGSTTWSNWIMGTATMQSSFVPDAGRGTYSFKAHVKQSSSGNSCTYSSAVSITVS
jgi:plastocyanin